MDEPVTEMSTAECWEFLRRQELGRLAFRLVDEVHLVPVNYAVDHDPVTDRRTILFRTAEGSKLLGVVMHGDVALEADELVDEHAASVVVRGRAWLLDEHEAHRADTLPLRPWVPTPRYGVVEIDPVEVTGRRFALDRPWRHMLPG
ncbi:pyridoxamine 5'-phosphate oxidase family protein [Nocardioides zeicaulis]|uniref:Pyridoxamine 5'-phosphate oxidase family protein n=1 Tax=Nocardioides zeicaulis TaxID=1776857 RepID=A0ABV6E0V9_9ACTN